MEGFDSRLETLLEVAALQAVHGVDIVALPDMATQHLVDAAASGNLEEGAAAVQLHSDVIEVLLRCRADAASEAGGVQDSAGAAARVEVEVQLSLPPGYPGGAFGEAVRPSAAAATAAGAPEECPRSGPQMAAAARVGGVRLGLRGGGAGGGGRDWCDGLTGSLTALAQQAAAEGRPCLHDLWEHLAMAAEELAQAAVARQLQQPAALASVSGSSPSGWGDGRGDTGGGRGSGAATAGGGDSELQVVLLRLDHMHNRGLYCRTIGSWIRELRLTGRLIFQGGLILILLEGDADALRDYLVRHRTESVDVDSRGRKCKERMMDVIVQQPRGPLMSGPQATSAAAADGAGRAFADFREVQLETLEQVGEVLRQAGLGDWLRRAAGLDR